ncbi:ABC transporter permease [Agromyces luteolus]|uniref:ABC transporter permease subunit n=1 Tax=Agromyces luteolus TaxID=88373 RepID=A0A7C9I1U2_9MICO|nr:ABC transporter permease [Agromyces luteolus]MUN08620.1 ABC transporter permease subunit [Agromyces luteolus]GLK27160.1 ABC transporter permease [Agromyces luteolus]
MTLFVLRRIGAGLVLVAVIVVLAFFLLHFAAGDIARTILGPTASVETVTAKRAALGLDKPLLEQFWLWLSSATGGDLGRSWFTGQEVSSSIVTRATVTVTVVIGTTLISAILATVLGVLAAVRRGVVDAGVQVLSVLGFAIPGFIIAIFLVDVFALRLGWLPATGYVPFSQSIVGSLRSTALPIAALSIGAIAAVAQQVRGSMIEALEAEWVRTLRSRGLSTRRVLFRHVLRNAAGPALSILALQFVGLLGGAVVIEQIFAIPGLGQVSVQAAASGDIPLVLGLVLAITLIVVAVNLIIDILQGVLNPKVRVS